MKPFRYPPALLWLFTYGLLAACAPKPVYIGKRAAQSYFITDSTAQDTAILSLLRPYKKGVDTQMQVVVGHASAPLTKAQPESSLGNFVADATLFAARKIDPKVNFAVSNYGGLRIPYMAPGAITLGKLYELMPFDNMLVIVQIPGAVIEEFCNHMAARRGWPVSGITYTIAGSQAKDIKVGGEPISSGKVYSAAVNDYISKGGDDCDFLLDLSRRPTTVFIRDAIIAYLSSLEQQGKMLEPITENRVQYGHE